MKIHSLFILVFLFPISATVSEESFSVIFADENKTKITVSLVDGKGSKQYDGFLEYPVSFDSGGKAIKTERRGLGFFVEVKVLARHEDSVSVSVKLGNIELKDWIVYQTKWGEVRQPVFVGRTSNESVILPVGEWWEPDLSEIIKQRASGESAEETITKTKVNKFLFETN